MPSQDHFEDRAIAAGDPLTGGLEVTPDDDADLPILPRAVMVRTAGDLSVVMRDGSSVVLPELSPGAIYPVRVRRVRATGTTASGIVGLY